MEFGSCDVNRAPLSLRRSAEYLTVCELHDIRIHGDRASDRRSTDHRGRELTVDKPNMVSLHLNSTAIAPLGGSGRDRAILGYKVCTGMYENIASIWRRIRRVVEGVC